MYRVAVKRLLTDSRRLCVPNPRNISLMRATFSNPYNRSFSIENPSQSPYTSPPGSESQTSSTSSSVAEDATASRRFDSQGSGRRESHKTYEDEQARILKASLSHVKKLGWGEAAMMAGARDVGLSPSIVGSFPRKEAALVEYFMDDCLQRLIDKIDSDEELNGLIPSERISKLVRTRLEMQIPYISTWAQALSIQALPTNIPTSFKQRAMLVDEIWHAAGDDALNIDWYVKRTVLGGIYSTTEVYMLADNSQDFRDTWAFLDGRVRDAFDMKKTMQEASYLAEAVSAGMGNTFQGLKKVFEGRSFSQG